MVPSLCDMIMDKSKSHSASAAIQPASLPPVTVMLWTSLLDTWAIACRAAAILSGFGHPMEGSDLHKHKMVCPEWK